jgi:hypothetical protein
MNFDAILVPDMNWKDGRDHRKFGPCGEKERKKK